VKKIIFVLLGFFVNSICNASNVDVGFFLGANFSNYDWFTTSPANEFQARGYGGMGGLSFSFFQDQRFGFRLAGFDYFVNQTAASIMGPTEIISGSAPVGIATIDVNFDLGPNRHSFGIGYGYEELGSLNFSGGNTFPASSSGTGIVIDGKDFWKSGWFDYVVIFIPHDDIHAYYSIYTFAMGIGYEFGH
jgi:hypothetical protein